MRSATRLIAVTALAALCAGLPRSAALGLSASIPATPGAVRATLTAPAAPTPSALTHRVTLQGKPDQPSAIRPSVSELTGLTFRDRGRGVTVAVVDSGIDEVPALTDRVIQGADFTGQGPQDDFGHGTFVAGLMAGDGTDVKGKRTSIVGAAPAARLISVKVADAQGRSTARQLAQGIAWVIDHRAAYGIGVLNLSLSSSFKGSADASPINALVEAAWSAGISVVASAGNDGGRVQSAPGNDPWVITVGTVDDKATITHADDTLAPFSNHGQTVDGIAKPEVLAPGEHVQAPLPAGSVLASRQTVSGLPPGYGQMSGTSMSAAVVSGEVAALLGVMPGLSPDQVKGALVGSVDSAGEPTAAGVARIGGNRPFPRPRPSLELLSAYSTLIVHQAPYKIDWTTFSPDAVSWVGLAWADATWTNATWTSSSSSDATWTNVTWTDATWTNATWTSATWTNATWTNATWTDATWTSATWTSATWTSATWTDSAWESA